MLGLATGDTPDLLCLQEVPVWALAHVGRWTGMQAFGDVAAPPRIGPAPSTPEIGRVLTWHHGFLRGGFTGQANAILASQALRPLARFALTLNSRNFRRRQARWLALPLVARLAWAKERRICQAVRFARGDGSTLLAANLHATHYTADQRLPDAELLRAAVFVDALSRPDETCILVGDFNVRSARSWNLAELTKSEWGFARAGLGPGVDHVLVRGAATTALQRWPDDRRRRDGLLLSDHAPVELTLR